MLLPAEANNSDVASINKNGKALIIETVLLFAFLHRRSPKREIKKPIRPTRTGKARICATTGFVDKLTYIEALCQKQCITTIKA